MFNMLFTKTRYGGCQVPIDPYLFAVCDTYTVQDAMFYGYCTSWLNVQYTHTQPRIILSVNDTATSCLNVMVLFWICAWFNKPLCNAINPSQCKHVYWYYTVIIYVLIIVLGSLVWLTMYTSWHATCSTLHCWVEYYAGRNKIIICFDHPWNETAELSLNMAPMKI